MTTTHSTTTKESNKNRGGVGNTSIRMEKATKKNTLGKHLRMSNPLERKVSTKRSINSMRRKALDKLDHSAINPSSKDTSIRRDQAVPSTTRENYNDTSRLSNLEKRKFSKTKKSSKNKILLSFKKRLDSLAAPSRTDRTDYHKKKMHQTTKKPSLKNSNENVNRIFEKQGRKTENRKSILTKLLSPKRTSQVSYQNRESILESKGTNISFVSSKKGKTKTSTRIKTDNDSISITVEHYERQKIVTPYRDRSDFFKRNRKSSRVTTLKNNPSKNSVSTKKSKTKKKVPTTASKPTRWTNNMKKILLGKLGSPKASLRAKRPDPRAQVSEQKQLLYRSMDNPFQKMKGNTSNGHIITGTKVKVSNIFSSKKTSPLAGIIHKRKNTAAKGALTQRLEKLEKKKSKKNSIILQGGAKRKGSTTLFRANGGGGSPIDTKKKKSKGPVAIDFLFDSDLEEFKLKAVDDLVQKAKLGAKSSKKTITCSKNGTRFTYNLKEVEGLLGAFTC